MGRGLVCAADLSEKELSVLDTEADGDFLPPGTPIDRDNCAREAIHLPGAIQPQGVLLCSDVISGLVVQASANAEALFGRPAPELLGVPLEDLLGAAVVQQLIDRSRQTKTPNLRPLRLTLDNDNGVLGRVVDAFAYSPAGSQLVVELEFADDNEPSRFDEFQHQVTSSLAELQVCGNMQDLVEVAARMVKRLTGFDRVWVYRFEADGHGVIVAEDKEKWVAPFLGLHYPAGDIPIQARALFLQNGLRLIPDVAYRKVPLIPVANPKTGEWLDLSKGILRGVSPVHIEYLQNMGVRASMSISLAVDGKLWGLISAHNYTGPKLVPHIVRAACEFVGVTVSMLLPDKAELETYDYRLELEQHQHALLEQVAKADTVLSGLVASEADLLGVCGATGVAVKVNDELRLIGRTPPAVSVRQLIDTLASRDDADVVFTDCLRDDFSGLTLDPDGPAGMVAAPLSRLHGNYVLWFRPEWRHAVTWGESAAPVVHDDDGKLRLAPRESFEKWSQEVMGRSRPWLAVEVDAAQNLRSALGTFLLSRAEQLERANASLASANAELDSFAYVAAHDLKEPLRGIYSHASFLAEDYSDVLDEEGRNRLGAMLRLSQRMSGLLDSLMEYATIGLTIAPCPLGEVVAEAAELLTSRLAETGAELIAPDNLPVLQADRDRLTEVLTNLISNAAKYHGEGRPRIEVSVCRLADTRTGRSRVRTPVDAETDPIVVCVADNGIGVPLAMQEEIFRVFKRLHAGDAFGGGAGAGLTIARRIVERHGGTLWVESEPGHGSRFYFTLGG
jgi:two-component system, chemotaxis family, sensor kinase Cph1